MLVFEIKCLVFQQTYAKMRMSKLKFSLVSNGTVATADWDICFLCQQNSREKPICPSKSTQEVNMLDIKL